MLIHSARHKPEDLEEYYRLYDRLDAANAENPRLERIALQAMEDIADFVASHDAYIGVSWGKDSVTVADLAMRMGLNIPLVHMTFLPFCTPEHEKVRDAFLEMWPNAQYHEEVCDYGDIETRGLTDEEQTAAEDPIFKAAWRRVNNNIAPCHISGVRGVESKVRRIRMHRWGVASKNTLAPIGWWKTEDVYAYIYSRGLPLHPNYGMIGGGRWDRQYIRVDGLGGKEGARVGRGVWEAEYYQDVLNRLHAGTKIQ